MNTLTASLGVGILLALAASPAESQQAVRIKEERSGLFARARLAGDSARSLALAAVPGGRITEAELEEEHGKLVYSFDITVPGKRGIEEVQIDALTGALVSREHESEDTDDDSDEDDSDEDERKGNTSSLSGRGGKRLAPPPASETRKP